MIKGFPNLSPTPIVCETCYQYGMKDHYFHKKAMVRATQPLLIIHSDIKGPFKTSLLNNTKYAINFCDDYSRFVQFDSLKSQNSQDILASIQKVFIKYKS